MILQATIFAEPTVTVEPDTESDHSRPTKRSRRLPAHLLVPDVQLHDKRLKKLFPEALPALPPPGVDIASSSHTPASPGPMAESLSDTAPQRGTASGLRRILDSAKNSFSLFRRYRSEKFPSHDPEGDIRESDLLDIVDVRTPAPDSTPSYGPYPNKTSFLLGDWYWNRGAQKSREDFEALLAIVSADNFRPGEIRETNWNQVNNQLANGTSDEEEWIDEDAGWEVSPVTISVPFDHYADTPGPRDFTFANLYHRSLVAVIRDKIGDPNHHAHFHHQPYELLWQPNDHQEAIRVYGELYSSPAFVDAHTALQGSPPEPKCDLERVVVALMFWSDGTQLTNFGNAKLWPLYMFFGNDSKYWRCKPSANCCEHVAYFETVRPTFSCRLFVLNFRSVAGLFQGLCVQVHRREKDQNGILYALSS